MIASVGGEDLPVVVYLPRRSAAPPRRGATVSGPARFLTVWEDQDAAGEPRSYPVLVARDLRETHAPRPPGGRAAWIPGLAAGAVALSGVAWTLARRNWRRAGRAGRIPRAHAEVDAGGPGEAAPADPAEALGRLADRSGWPPGGEAANSDPTEPPPPLGP